MTHRFAIFRADASAEIGGGHVMRCLTLANALSEAGWRCGFACSAETAAIVPVLQRSGHEHFVLKGDPADEPAGLAKRWDGGVDLLVVDHYGRDSAFESACRPWAKRIMVIDDLADRPHDCNILLDQALGRRNTDYKDLVPDGCELLLGPGYALLRPEFAKLRTATLKRRKERHPVRRILVSVGATDPHNVSAVALEGIAQSGLDVEVDLVAGAASPHLESLCGLAARLPLQVTVHDSVADMAALMARADLAVGATGVSALERCCLGLPALGVIAAENQRQNALELKQQGAVVILGKRKDLVPPTVAQALRLIAEDTERLRTMAVRAAAVCDGRGAGRVTMAADPVVAKDGQPIRLAPASTDDADVMLDWQSDPRTRRYFRNPAIPTPDEHRDWLKRRLADPGCIFNLIMHVDEPAGVLRLERIEAMDPVAEVYEVSVLVAPGKYRLGLAKAALTLARRLAPSAEFRAQVAPANLSSHALFTSAGYELRDEEYVSRPVPAANTV